MKRNPNQQLNMQSFVENISMDIRTREVSHVFSYFLTVMERCMYIILTCNGNSVGRYNNNNNNTFALK